MCSFWKHPSPVCTELGDLISADIAFLTNEGAAIMVLTADGAGQRGRRLNQVDKRSAPQHPGPSLAFQDLNPFRRPCY